MPRQKSFLSESLANRYDRFDCYGRVTMATIGNELAAYGLQNISSPSAR